MKDAIEYLALLARPNVRPFLDMLRVGEGTSGEDGYRVLFGGAHLPGLDGVPGTADDFADHPRKAITRKLGGKPITSTAAGAYQFLSRTWDECAKALGLADFSPRNQDIAALFLIDRRKALDDVLAGRFEVAVNKCAREWASLPGSPYGQPVKTMAQARASYVAAGGAFVEAPPTPHPAAENAPRAPEPGTAWPFATPQKDSTMPTIREVVDSPLTKFALAAVNPLLAAVPEVAKLFMDKDGTTVPERNVAAAVKMVEVAQAALNGAGIPAANAQAVAEAVGSNQAAKEVVRQAVISSFYELTESGGGGIDGARKSNTEMIAAGINALRSPAFILSCCLLVFPMLLCVDVFFVHPDAYSGEIRTQIVTGILLCISMVGAFWLGSSFGSARKDERA